MDSNDSRDIVSALREGNLSIEHVMPQTLTESWTSMLGEDAQEVHATWIHRIANLTVTGYNSKYFRMSSFETKKSMEHGFAESPYRINKPIKDSNAWDETALKNRSKFMLDRALAYWSFPATTYVPKKVELPVEAMGVDASFTNRKVLAYTLFDELAMVKSWRDVLTGTMSTLAGQHHSRFHEFAATSAQFTVIGTADEAPRGFRMISPGLAVLTSSSTWEKIQLIRRAFGYFDADPDDLVFTLQPTADEDQNEEQEDSLQHIYSGITNVLPSLRNLDIMSNTDVKEFRDGFRAMFDDFRDTEPESTLEDLNAADFVNTDELPNASVAQLLAVITQWFVADGVFKGYFEQRVQDGSLSRLLALIDELELSTSV